jgi:ribosomal protein L19
MKELEIKGKKFKINQSIEISDTYEVGDNVRLLVKEYSEMKAYSGLIVAIDDFTDNPAVTVCYITDSCNPEIKFKTLTPNDKDTQVAKSGNFDESLSINTIISSFENKITSKKGELETLMKQFNNINIALNKIANAKAIL